jgi:hypothetical protein
VFRNRVFWGILAAGALAHVVVFVAVKDFQWKMYLPRIFGGVTVQNFFTGIKYAAEPENGRRPVAEKQFTVTSTLVKMRADGGMELLPPAKEPVIAPVKAPTAPTATGSEPASQKPAARPKRGAARLFGIPARAQRVVFLLDVSGSMFERAPDGATRMQHARRHLAEVIENLPPGREFNVVLFAGGTQRFVPAPVPATDENKAAAVKFLDTLPDFEGSTDLSAGLNDALALAPGEVFVVTDGMPNTGQPVTVPDLDTVWDGTVPRTPIHTIGFFLERDGADEKFLRQLSEQTGGLYVGWRGERLSAR